MSDSTDAELDRRHEAVVARYPGGLTPAQFRTVTLESADENGRVYPPSLADWWARQSLLMGMAIGGLIRPRDYLKGGPYVLTEAGRRAAAGTPKEQKPDEKRGEG